MEDIIQNLLMTVLLFPLSMLLVRIYMWINGPYDKKLYWQVVIAGYIVMLVVCWGVETGLLYKIINTVH